MVIARRSMSWKSRGPMPDRPSRMAAMVSAALRPRALIAPWPVITTRRIGALLLRRDQVLHGAHHGGDAADVELGVVGIVGVKRHLDVKALLDGEDRLHQPQRVDPEILQRRLHADLAGL